MFYCRDCGKRIDIRKKRDNHLCYWCRQDTDNADLVDKLSSGNFKQESYDPYYEDEPKWENYSDVSYL